MENKNKMSTSSHPVIRVDPLMHPRGAGSTSSHPVIVFFTDQQRADSLGVHGCPLDLTPNLDRLAAENTHLYHLFTCQPVCGPARSSLQTGRYARTVGCYRNGIPLPRREKTMAHHFAEAGYHTAYIGKWHLAPDEQPGAVKPEDRGGYQTWLASNLLEFSSDAYQTRLWDNEGVAQDLPGYRADALTDAAIRFIASHKDEPFFLFISYIEPHHQNHRDDYPAPTGYENRYTGRYTPPDLAVPQGSAARHLGGYYGMIKRLDECLGRLLDALKSLGLDEKTLLLYTSDHGCHFKTRNGEYKRSAHDASIRVPGVLAGGPFRSRGRLPELVSLVDLPPTLLDACGLPVPAEMQGRSVLPLVRREAPNWPQEVYVEVSESQVGRAIRSNRWKYAVKAPGQDGWAAGESKSYVEDLLYDLDADPWEQVNLIGHENFRAVADELKTRLIKRAAEAGEVGFTITEAPVVKSGQRQVRVENALAEMW